MGCYYNEDGSMVICTGSNRYTKWPYVARVHRTGARKWEIVSRHRSKAAAIKAMAKAFATDTSYFRLNRADVIFCQDYYDPVQVCELRKR